MNENRASLRRVLVMVVLLLGAALACNAPTREAVSPPAQESPVEEGTEASDDEGEAPEEETPEEESTSVSPATVPPRITAEEEDGQEEETALPTFTPIDQPTLKATPTSSRTPMPRDTNTPRPSATSQVTDTPDGSAGPLSFDYNITWEMEDPLSRQATATVTIRARGGGGGYKYYRDELPVDGPVFEYEWAVCSGNPGSLRVDSADGQSVKIDYFVRPYPEGPLPCPTPTPTP